MPDLAIVVPTLNERDNVEPLLAALDRALAGVSWEAVFVDDDSTDGTSDLVRAIAQRRGDVRVVQRIGRRGLSSAAVEGILASSAPYVAVMDADLQHDETLLPRMLETLKGGALDIVVATRFGAESSLGDFAASRERLSRAGILLSRLVVKERLSDPLSGFFMLTRPFFDEVAHDLSGHGFKILIDLFASARRRVRFAELPFRFGSRQHGESKLDAMVKVEYLELLADKLIGRWVPVRFVVFVLMGSLGLLFHLAVLGVAHVALALPFLWAQGAATVAAMTSNFFLNNAVTYRDRRLRGGALLRGLLTFYLVCGAGAVINFQVAEFLYELGAHWAIAGLIGGAVSAVWNFAVSSAFTWTRPRRRPAPRPGHTAGA